MKGFEMPCSINCKYTNEDDCISYEKACLDTLDNYDK